MTDVAGLHERGMQIKVVRHHSRAEHRDRDVKAPVIDARHESAQDAGGVRMRHKELYGETDGDDGDEVKNKRFEIANPEFLQPEHEERIEGSQGHRGKQRNVEEEIERDGSSQ